MVTHDKTLASRFTRTLEITDGELKPFSETTDEYLEEVKNEHASL